MTWIKGAEALLAPSPGCATDRDLKNLECALKKHKQQCWYLKKMFSRFHVLFQVIITNEVLVPVTIL